MLFNAAYRKVLRIERSLQNAITRVSRRPAVFKPVYTLHLVGYMEADQHFFCCCRGFLRVSTGGAKPKTNTAVVVPFTWGDVHYVFVLFFFMARYGIPHGLPCHGTVMAHRGSGIGQLPWQCVAMTLHYRGTPRHVMLGLHGD